MMMIWYDDDRDDYDDDDIHIHDDDDEDIHSNTISDHIYCHCYST